MKSTGVDLSYDRVAIQRLREAAERAKITLSTTKETNIEVPFIARGPKGILNLDLKFTRADLESLTDDLVGRTVQTCERIFEEASMKPDAIDEVLLVGGQSRMPLVQQRVRDYFGKDPCKGVHPDEAVAVGAAIMAHSLTHASSEKVTLLDVLPMPIGIAKVDRSFLPLFPKNCPIPHVRRLTLTNSKDNQKTIMLKIYQGDSDIAAENELLGTFVFSGIREMPRGKVKVDVWLNIDSEGILSISAKDKETGAPVEVHLKLKSKTVSATLSLHTEARGGQMMDAAAADKKKKAAEAKAKKEAKDAGEVPAVERTADFGQAPEPPKPAQVAPPKPKKKPEPPKPAAPKAKSAPGKRKGKGIVVEAPPPKAAEPAEPKAEPKPKAEPEPESKPGAPVPTSKDEPKAEVPVKAADAKPPVAEEEGGCLSLLLPWNWFK